MEINPHEERRLVEVWVSQKDQASRDVQERLRNLYRRCAEEHYTVAVFCSGRQDLAEETSALLQYNRRRSAEQSVRQRRTRKRQNCQ